MRALRSASPGQQVYHLDKAQLLVLSERGELCELTELPERVELSGPSELPELFERAEIREGDG